MCKRLLSSLMVVLVFALTPAGVAAAPPRDDGQVRSVDDEFVRMGREIPGFGGLYYDEQGRPNVFLLDPDGAGRTALKNLGVEALVHRGDYEFERLVGWRLELRPILALPGVVFLDVDETRNRVVVGFDAASKSLDRDRLEQQILSSGVPRQAVLLQETARIRPFVGLQDRLRPAPGGVQVVFSGFACTLGFNAVRGRDFGFVVASHCTDILGEVEGTRFYQSLPGTANAIGTEIADPSLFTDSPCPSGMRCRFSDTAFAKYDKPTLGALAKIARPSANGSQSGPLTLKTPTARLTIKGRTSSPLVGDVVHKIGRTTGWTYGPVIGTCVDVNEDVDITLLCQSVVQIGGGPGDSGAPVFVPLSGNNARLVGLLWGGGDDPNLGVVGVFSPLENIETDLGPLKIN
ncbi:MAG: hypothetical protein WAM82_20955 [Thermoanaerobaculia bacterium]